MSIPFGHHELHNRYIFVGALEVVTPLKISAGIASQHTDAPFMSDFSGRPYIPGSSIRGAIRAEVERIVSALDSRKTGITTCISFEKGNCADKVKDFQKQLADNQGAGTDSDIADARLAEFMEEKFCDVCRLFGTAGYATRIFFEDCKLLGGESTAMLIRDGVGIDRDTGSAREGAKFDYEVIEKGCFSFRMTAENLELSGPDKKLVNLILSLLISGIFVGGKRAGGMGKLKLKPDYSVSGFKNPESLWAEVSKGKTPYSPIDWNKEAEKC